jgi:hypothetical protein
VDPEAALEPLFARAKSVDEFEFACALLRVRGLEDAGWDPLEESNRLTEDLAAVIQSPILPAFRSRLILFLYCHVTEMDDLYNIPANLLRVCAGERFVMHPFAGELSPDGKTADKPISKAKRVRELAVAGGFDDITALYDYFLVNRVRNAFFHSTYTLVDDAFRITAGPGVTIDRVTSARVPYDWLLPRMETAINLSTYLVESLIRHRRSYTSNKVITGRLGPDGGVIPVELVGGDEGLVGFRTPVGG